MLLEDITRFRLLDEVKSNLVATVSHELKTPLTSIRLVLHLLLEESVGPLTPKQLELLVDARDNAERLLVMINNLLDLARLEQGPGQLRVHPERPAALLQAAADSFRPRAADQGVELVVEDCGRPAAGGRRRRAVPARVAESARQRPGPHAAGRAHHPGRASRPTARSSFPWPIPARESRPSTCRSCSNDTSACPATRRRRGSGLGLAIVREIVTAHGGTVQCESRPGEKTVFRLALPCATGAPKAAQENITARDAQRSLHR